MAGFHYRCPLCNELMTIDKRRTHHNHCPALTARPTNCAYEIMCQKLGIKR